MNEEIQKKEGQNEVKSDEELIIKEELEKRKKQLIKFFKERGAWVYGLVFMFIAFIGLQVRVLNLSKLKDITTGTWTLGPDLDPFLFLRWAKYIVANGKLMTLDVMRYVPMASICSGAQCTISSPYAESGLLPYAIAGLYNIMHTFSQSVTVTYAAVVYPVVMFAFAIIAFFLFARKIFYKLEKNKRNIIALISTSLFVLIPSMLPRTIAGIPEKESGAFCLIFFSFYFFLEAFTSEKMKKSVIFSILAGISTGLLALDWGGSTFVFITIPVAVLFAFLIGKIGKKEFYSFGIWILVSLVIMMTVSSQIYTLESIITSTSTEMMLIVFIILLVDSLIFGKKILNINEKFKKIKLPSQVISVIITLLIAVIMISIIFGPSLITNNIGDFISSAVHPLAQDRFTVTVAENKQPYFVSDWKGEFGPIIAGIPLYFWMFFIGAIFLFNYLIKPLKKKEKILLTLSYSLFLFCLIFSNYSSSSTLNGESGLSMLVYALGFLSLAISFIYVYIKRYKKGELSIFKELEFAYILYFIVFTLGIIGARGAIRLVMVLGAISPIAAGFLVFKVPEKFLKEKDETRKFFVAVAALLIICAFLFTLWGYYQSDKSSGENYAPSSYQWQWQNAMAWVRNNTSPNAVFAHWWDYGYWVQSIGERATILDGGNAIGYWDYLMGRLVLTGTSESDALQFLYTHNATNLLIDSTDIGKYSAFSSIGSNGSYDRFSWISTFAMDTKQTQETKDENFYVYTGGTANDEDITWDLNGTEAFLPGRSSAVAAIVLKQDVNGTFLQPTAIFQYNGIQYPIPLRYAYINNTLDDFNSGLDAGIFIIPSTTSDSAGKLSMNNIGTLFYLSPRTIHSQLVQLYLFNEQSSYFKLAHTESDLFVSYLKSKGVNTGDFIYYNGNFMGPIKIWSISYPAGIKPNPAYLETVSPPDTLSLNTGYG